MTQKTWMRKECFLLYEDVFGHRALLGSHAIPHENSTGLLSLRATGAVASVHSGLSTSGFSWPSPIAFISSTNVVNTLAIVQFLVFLSNLFSLSSSDCRSQEHVKFIFSFVLPYNCFTLFDVIELSFYIIHLFCSLLASYDAEWSLIY